MSSKRDKLKNAMSKNIFNYEKETFTPVNDLIESLPSENLNELNITNESSINKNNDFEATQEIPIISCVTTTSIEQNKINNITEDKTNIEPADNFDSALDNILNEEQKNQTLNEGLNKLDNLALDSIIDSSDNSPTTQIDSIQPQELSTDVTTSIFDKLSLELFKNGCNNIENSDALTGIKNYFLQNNKNTISISIRLDKELDVFSKIEAYKNGLNLNMYYNYIIFKDMQFNAKTQNYNPAFDINNNCLYRKTPAYNAVQKTFSIISELKEYISIYGAKLGVTPGNYFKYLLRKEYEKSDNSCIN